MQLIIEESPRAGAPSRNKETLWKNDADWLGLLSLACSASFPRDDTSHSGLGPPTSISNPENAPWTEPQDNLREAITSKVMLGHGS